MYRALVPALLGAAVLSACSHETKTAAAPDIAPYVSTREADRIEYAVPNHLLFATDSSEVLPTGHKILEAIAGAAKRRGAAPIEVAGYADTVGRKTYNQKLSEKRAGTVFQYLVDKGIATDRLVGPTGYGEANPLVATGDKYPECKNETNRRTELNVQN